MDAIPVSIDRPPIAIENPRHAVWIDDEQGLRRITAANPGAEQIQVGEHVYTHTRELSLGQWVYTKNQVEV